MFQKYILRNTRAKIGITIITIFGLVAIFAPVLAPHNPWSIEFMPWQRPSMAHPMGVNSYGQDILSQVLYGTRPTMLVGILAGLMTSFIGVIVGITTGYKGGWIDEVLMRFVDVLIALPNLALIIVITSFLDSMSLRYTVIMIGFLIWLWMARTIRAQTMTEARRDYVDAAKSLGMGDLEIMFKEILPNITPVITANMVMVITAAMLMEATMSFLGIGDPMTISWGRIMAIGFDTGAIFMRAWWWILPPGFLLSTLGFSFMLIGNSFLDIYAKDRGGAVKL